MASTVVLEKVADEPDPQLTVSVDGLRFVTVRANLMPDEVLVARRTEVLRRKVVMGLIALVALIIAGYGASWVQTHTVGSDLDDLNGQNAALTNQQSQFAPLVRAQGDSAMIKTQLSTLMTGDLSWKSMLTTLRSKAPAGVTLTSITGAVTSTTAAGAAGAGAADLNQSGKATSGTLTIAGTAGSKTAVASYVEALTRTKGLTAPLPTSVAATEKGFTFSLSVLITADALGGRYAVAATPTTGATTAPTTTGGN